MSRQRARKPYRHRYDPGAAPLGQRDVAVPLGPLDHELSFRQVDIGPLQGHDLATAKPSVSTQKHGEMGLYTNKLRRLDQTLVRGEVVERRHRLGCAEQRDLARHALDHAPFDRHPKKGGQNRQDIVDGLRSLLRQTGLEPLDVLVVDCVQRLGAECRNEMNPKRGLLRGDPAGPLPVDPRVPVEPRDPAWLELCTALKVILVWPGRFHAVLQVRGDSCTAIA